MIFNLVLDVTPRLEKLWRETLNHVEFSVSQLSDQIAALGSSLDAALARVQEDVTTLTAKIAELQAKVDAGLATPEDFAALAANQAKLDALDPVKPDTLPEPTA